MTEHWNIPTELSSDYLKKVKEFATTDSFYNFKRDETIKIIMENTYYESGVECLEILKKDYPHILESVFTIGGISEKEKIGNPDTSIDVSEDFTLSGTTLRYLMHLAQIESWIGFLDDLTIGEIGAGYGGLCTIMHEYFSPKRYILFDMPEAMDFQVKYIKKFNPDTNVNRWRDIKKKVSLDLIIAFCSWSELDIDTKLDYLYYVIKNANKGVLGINYEFEENLQLLKDTMPEKTFTVRVPGFIVTFE